MEQYQLRKVFEQGIQIRDAIHREGCGLHKKLCPRAIARLDSVRNDLFNLGFPIPLVDSENIKTSVIALKAAVHSANHGRRLDRAKDRENVRDYVFNYCMLACDCLQEELEKFHDVLDDLDN